jgi:hypothetical protein
MLSIFQTLHCCSGLLSSTTSTPAETFLFSFEINSKKSFLLGTYHLVSFDLLPNPLKEHVRQCSVFVTENTDIQKTLGKRDISAMGLLRKDDEPEVLIDPKEREELLKYVLPFLASRCSGEVRVEHLNSVGLRECYEQGHFLNGMDRYLLSYFKEKGSVIDGLESAIEVSKSIHHDAKRCEDGDSEDCTESYLTGFIPPDKACSDSVTFTERNLAWLPKVEEFNKKYGDKVVIAVGFYHLFGESGLINLLRKNGFIFQMMNANGIFCDFPDRSVDAKEDRKSKR